MRNGITQHFGKSDSTLTSYDFIVICCKSWQTMTTQIMYIEKKEDGVNGPARIGRVAFSQTGRSVYYRGRMLQKVKGGFKANYIDAETREEYWISGCKKKGGDRLYSGTIEIDDDAREDYWVEIRQMPDNRNIKVLRAPGKYAH